jgi:hypothetical protein
VVPKLLKLPHLREKHGMTDVEVGSRGVEPCLDRQGAPRRQPLFELRSNVEVDDAAGE